MGAAENGHHECISILVANGANVNAGSKVRYYIVECTMYNGEWRMF